MDGELVTLDEDQQRVVNLNEGYYAVLAGAGSGKSTVLLHRTGRLHGAGTDKGILCVTFTSEAAKNLRSRCGKLFPNVSSDTFRTLHALALNFAYTHPNYFPFRLSDNCLAEEGIAARCVFDAIGDKINFKAFTTWVSLQKRKRVSPAEAVIRAEQSGIKFDYAIGYKRYQNLLRKQGVLDFDDLIFYMVEILEQRPDLRNQWQYDYVMQDEAQDACELDWRLLQLLTEKNKNLLCVGDSGQALFGFRGGVSKHLLEMDVMFPRTKTLYLGNNYRSLPGIVEFGKKAYPFPNISTHFKSVRDGLATISVIPYSNEYREAEETILKVQKYGPETCAVLARTNLALRPIEEACLDAGVEYHLLGDSGFWESPEVQNVMYYLRCIVNPTDNAVIGAIRSPFWPSKYVRKKSVVESIVHRTKSGESAWRVINSDPYFKLQDFISFVGQRFGLRNISAGEAILQIIKDLKAVEHYKDEDNINPDRNPVANLKELANAAKRYDSISEFLDFLRRLSYARNSRKGVCLSTIHQSKGREFENVFLVSCNQGVIPHVKSENIEEEKCCFFVGVSRAMNTLQVSYYGQPSVFLEPFLKVVEA